MKFVKSLSFTFLSVFLAPTLQKNTPFFENITNEIPQLKYAQLICKPVRSEKKKIVQGHGQWAISELLFVSVSK